MAIQGIGSGAALDGGLTLSFRQANVQIGETGSAVTATKMYESLPHLAKGGVETNIGTSEFSQNNDEIISESVNVMAEIMEKDDEFVEVSNAGNETNMSSSGFHEMNDISINAQQQVAARAYEYFN